MNFPGRQSPDSTLPSYDFARSLGHQAGADIDFKKLADKLDCMRNFYHVGIIFDDGRQSWLVRPSRRIADANQSTVSHVVISKVPDIKQPSAEKAVVAALTAPSLATEITSTGFACGAMIVTLVMAFGAGAAVPFTAGGSGIIAAISLSGTLATGAQCMIGAGRLLAIHTDHGSDIAWLDSQDWYVATSTALDVISLAAAGVALKGTVETYKLMKAASSSKVTAWFQSLSRAERKRITEEIIKAQNPGISSSGVKAAIRAGVYPKRFPSESLQKSLQRELVSAVNNASAFVGSSLTGTIRNPQNTVQSGRYVVGLLQSFSPN
ncbi:hypothetical protein [Pseudescherichia vulneris]|uniref:hypothetical protein n=1 Tax=Pseudescherichia vulneris TaxID=566 RepID=UPI0028B0F2F1|nr:hypothetical protein [Pseudescherichia vulneris]